MSLNHKTDRCAPTEDDVYADVGSALGVTLKQMIPRLCHKYGMDRNTIVRATASATMEAGVFLEADHVRLTPDDAVQIAARVYEVMRDAIDDKLRVPKKANS